MGVQADRLEAPLIIPRLTVAVLALALFGAAPPLPPLSAEEASAARYVRAQVEFLADDRLEGRLTGSRGHEIAATYVASQFRALGLEPGGLDGQWFRQVPLRRASNEPGSLVASMSGTGGGSLRAGVDVAVLPSLTERHREINGELIFAGYGLDEPLLGFDDYRGLDVRGKIVVLLGGVPAKLPGDIAAHLRSTKKEAAAARGAAGLIILSGDGPRGDVAATIRRTVTDWHDGETIGDTMGVRAAITLSQEWQQRLFVGAAQSLAAVRMAAKSGSPRGFPLPYRLTLRTASSWEDFFSPEVIGKLPGTGPLAGEHVLLMAHLDHLGMKTDEKTGRKTIYNGALDNAAGVATMMEAARQLVASGKPPARTILFIANTGEEEGLVGADYLASHPPVPLASIAGVVDLDMPLPLYDFTDVIAFGADHSTIARTVAEAGRQMGIGVAADPMPQESIFVRSDHYRFVRRGVPAILLMTGYANGGEVAWKNFLARTYHSPADNLSQPIEWRSLARYGMLNARIARALADAPKRPRWIARDYFGDRFAPGQPRAPRP